MDAGMGLVGRCFVIFGDDRRWQYQGIVRGDLGQHYYLVQFFDAMMGEPSTMQVHHISEMKGGRAPGEWEFFEDDKHLRYWIENLGRAAG